LKLDISRNPQWYHGNTRYEPVTYFPYTSSITPCFYYSAFRKGPTQEGHRRVSARKAVQDVRIKSKTSDDEVLEATTCLGILVASDQSPIYKHNHANIFLQNLVKELSLKFFAPLFSVKFDIGRFSTDLESKQIPCCGPDNVYWPDDHLMRPEGKPLPLENLCRLPEHHGKEIRIENRKVVAFSRMDLTLESFHEIVTLAHSDMEILLIVTNRILPEFSGVAEKWRLVAEHRDIALVKIIKDDRGEITMENMEKPRNRDSIKKLAIILPLSELD
jgi:hypothetical protein